MRRILTLILALLIASLFAPIVLASGMISELEAKYKEPMEKTHEVGEQYYRNYGAFPDSLKVVIEYAQIDEKELVYSSYQKVTLSTSGNGILVKYFLTPEVSPLVEFIAQILSVNEAGGVTANYHFVFRQKPEKQSNDLVDTKKERIKQKLRQKLQSKLDSY